MSDKAKLIIEFDTQELLEGFASWLCNNGEQDYYQAQEFQNEPAVVLFDYHEPVNGRAEFIPNNIIRTRS